MMVTTAVRTQGMEKCEDLMGVHCVEQEMIESSSSALLEMKMREKNASGDGWGCNA